MLFKHNYASSNQLELINSIEDLANGDLLEIILKGKPEFKMFTSVLSLGLALTEQDMRFMNKLLMPNQDVTRGYIPERRIKNANLLLFPG